LNCSSAALLAGRGAGDAYSAPGATTSTTTYDDSERPSEVNFHDANNALLNADERRSNIERRAITYYGH
jgi:hypothetical protein